jgi:integrase
LAEYCKLEKAESQHREDKSVIDLYLNPAFGSVRLSDLSKKDLQDLKVKLSTSSDGRNKRPLKPKSVNNILGLAKKILATAVDWELIPVNPFQSVKRLKLGEQAVDYWMPEERDRFLRFARQLDPEFTRVVQLAVFSGLRRGEIAGLTRGDLDFERRLILVSRGYNFKLKKGTGRTKGGRAEHIPMNDRAAEALRPAALKRPTDRVFDADELRQAVRKLRALCDATGTRQIRFHDLRHTFASTLAMEGVDPYALQRLMRHASFKMTLRYLHLAPGYLREATDRLCPPAKESGPDLAPEASGKDATG